MLGLWVLCLDWQLSSHSIPTLTFSTFFASFSYSFSGFVSLSRCLTFQLLIWASPAQLLHRFTPLLLLIESCFEVSAFMTAHRVLSSFGAFSLLFSSWEACLEFPLVSTLSSILPPPAPFRTFTTNLGIDGVPKFYLSLNSLPLHILLCSLPTFWSTSFETFSGHPWQLTFDQISPCDFFTVEISRFLPTLSLP